MTNQYDNPLNHQPSFGFDGVKVQQKTNRYDGFFTLDCYQFSHQLYQGGYSKTVSRELLERGDAVVVLPYDHQNDEVVLIEQFRIGALGAFERDKRANKPTQSPWLIECIAGMVDKNRSAIDVVHAEAKEEAGITLSHAKSIMNLFSSPGGMSERVEYFVALTNSKEAKGIHGLHSENEDIRVLRVPLQEACAWISEGKINNASTVIALQWLQLHKNDYLTECSL